MSDTANRSAAAALRIRDAGEAFVALMDGATALAAEIAAADAEYRVAAHLEGVTNHRPPARELAAEVAYAALAPLRPYVRFVTAESGRRSAEALLEAGSLPAKNPCPVSCAGCAQGSR